MAKCCVVFMYGLDRKSRWTVVTLTLRFGGKVLCCIIYGLDRKSRLTVVTLTLRFGRKVLCCIIYGLDRKSRWAVVTLTLRFGGKVLCCIHIWFRQKIQMDCCDFDFKIWWQSAVLYSYMASTGNPDGLL